MGHPLPGPAGETCGTCGHRRVNRWTARSFQKCDLVKSTHGPATDTRCKWPACSRWETSDDR